MGDISKFSEGQMVVCINDDFPLVRTTEDDKTKVGTQAVNHPKIDEVLMVAEVLGEFIRFDKYKSDAWLWWHQNKFAPVDESDWQNVGLTYEEASNEFARLSKELSKN